MFPTLTTDRLVLREIKRADAPEIFDYFSNELVLRHYGMEPIQTMEEAVQLIDLFASNYAFKNGIRFAIHLKDENRLIGTIGFNTWSTTHKRADIGYELHPSYWRKGYMKEALGAVIPFGFNELQLNRIGANVFLENAPSNQLLIDLGFQFEGILRKYMIQNAIAYDVNVYSIVK